MNGSYLLKRLSLRLALWPARQAFARLKPTPLRSNSYSSLTSPVITPLIPGRVQLFRTRRQRVVGVRVGRTGRAALATLFAFPGSSRAMEMAT